jgi:hypothetical protein
VRSLNFLFLSVSTFPGREITFPKFTIMVICSHDFPCVCAPTISAAEGGGGEGIGGKCIQVTLFADLENCLPMHTDLSCTVSPRSAQVNPTIFDNTGWDNLVFTCIRL